LDLADGPRKQEKNIELTNKWTLMLPTLFRSQSACGLIVIC